MWTRWRFYRWLFPELERFPSELAAATAGQRVERDLGWRGFVFGMALSLPAIWLVPYVVVRLARWGWVGGLVGGALAGALLGLYMAVVMNLVFRNPARKSLRRSLLRLGVPICVGCGYDVRGQQEPRCPECGAAIEPPNSAGA